MGIISILLVAAVVFGICFLVDKLFTGAFRSEAQHSSGLAVRVNKRYGVIGVLVAVLGAAGVVFGIPAEPALWICGIILILFGICLMVYYLTFGVFYDGDSFLISSFGKKSRTYKFGDIKAQQLYVASGNVIIELHMENGETVSLQSGMAGVYPFMDAAFSGWCRQTGRQQEDCSFHDPANSCWFPAWEEG